jgi:hypothetical protein
VTAGTLKWLGTGDLGELVPPKRKPSKVDIFMGLCPMSAIEALVQRTLRTSGRGDHTFSVKDILSYWAVKIYLHSSEKKTLRENFPLPENIFQQPMGINRFKRLQRAWITPEIVEILNHASAEMVLFPEVITIDEKLRGYTGASPYKRYVPNKDPKLGHWITETVIKGRFSGLPYLLSAYPVQQNEGPTMLEFYQHSLRDVPASQRASVVVVSDAYYLDDRSRRWLRDSGFMYLMAVNPTRFKEVWKPLNLKAKRIGTWSIAWNATTEETAAVYWHPELGKKYLLTNAFRYNPSAEPLTIFPLWDAYGHLFNSADRLNHFYATRYYPYRREGWMYDFDDFHFTSLLWNTYVVFHEAHRLPANLPWGSFLIELAKELDKRVLSQ